LAAHLLFPQLLVVQDLEVLLIQKLELAQFQGQHLPQVMQDQLVLSLQQKRLTQTTTQ
jgi:hypothetical protein